eukprot:9349339-Alexandrium_andersonii.AAC.1
MRVRPSHVRPSAAILDLPERGKEIWLSLRVCWSCLCTRTLSERSGIRLLRYSEHALLELSCGIRAPVWAYISVGLPLPRYW